MKIVAISDTHNRHGKIVVPEGDIIIHAGDATDRGTKYEVEAFFKWYSSLDFNHHIYVPGNHDFLFEKDIELGRALANAYDITLLINETVDINGIKIHGIPDTPWFYNWAFNRARNDSEAAMRNIELMSSKTVLIPNDTDIIVSHGPPYNILDEVLHIDGSSSGRFVGCDDILAAVRRVKPDLFICGHIHSGHGEKHIDGTSFYNVAICDEIYSPSYEPTVIEYEKD